MDLLTKHWRKIVFGLVCAASIGVGTWGVMAGDAITKPMLVAEQLAANLRRLTGSSVSVDAIRQARADAQKRQGELEAVLKIAKDLQATSAYDAGIGPDGAAGRKPREPLTPGVLPRIERPVRAFNFREAYVREHAALTPRLGGGTPPSVADVQMKMAELRTAREAGKSDDPWSLVEAAEGTNPSSPLPGKSGAGGAAATISRTDVLRQDADALAALDRARTIRMYVDDGALGLHPFVRETDPPVAEQIWQAQMALWIQQDLVAALVRVNEARAAELARDRPGAAPWVAEMPVKRLIRLAIADRLGNGGGQNTQKTDFAPSFTLRVNDASMFVVPVQMQLVIEAAALNRLLAEVTRVGFFTPIAIQYESVRPDPLQARYVYGPRAVIELTLDLEGYYFREVFDPWIPEGLKPVLTLPDARDPTMRGVRS